MLGVALSPGEGAAAPEGPRGEDVREEVIVTAGREADERLTREVVTALQNDPYIFSDHITVTTANGVVRLEGRISDRADFFNVLRLARRIAGKRRVINNMEYVPSDEDSD